jgi:uncharacterized phage protein (TIGR01671 family)
MREIKFRIWNKISKKMQYNNDEENRFYINIDGSLTAYFKSIRGWESGSNLVSKGLYILLQFTGLYDKNGKEIYEGDIVKYKYTTGFNAEDDYREDIDETDEYKGIVEFKKGEFFPRECGSFPEDGFYAWRIWDIEVIGNVYENPELLQESNK